MGILERFISAIKGKIHANAPSEPAVSERIEEGRKTGDILPYLGPVIEDDCGVPDGLVGEWRAPV